ncbi:MAG: hypothetical protein IH602_12805 [Bryobacteraceae bacterium]|nr:hypothetical protein [Bryobacteraceae bacterium]
MIKAVTLPGLILSGALMCTAETPQEPYHFFRQQMGLTDSQIAMISRGKAVAKVIPSNTPAEIIIFGAVFVNANPEQYLKLALDPAWLRRSPSYLGVARFSDPPVLSDLEGFNLEPDDVRNLRSCRPGKCGVQLPADAMQTLQRSIDWSRPDAANHVNHRVRTMALDLLRRYQQDGNRVLGSYRDTDNPFDVNAQLQSLLGRSEVLPVYLPELNRYLLDYPNTKLEESESLFYWERVNFGMKPTLRLNHAISYHSSGPKGPVQVLAVKQLYASHYFQLALDLTACVRESGRTDEKGFYLISLKGSTQQGLTGWKGSLLRMVIVSRTRSAQENLLINIKRVLEEKR